MGLAKKQEKEYAKLLYLDTKQNLTQKEIAERVGVRENTLGKWIEAEGWDKLRVSLLTTKDNQLSMMYEQLDWLNRDIKNRGVVRDIPATIIKGTKLKDADGAEYIQPVEYNPEDYPIKFGNVATSKEADVIAKLTASIQRLENETSIGNIVEVAREFIEFSAGVDYAFSKRVTQIFDAFINSKMK